MGMSGSLVMSSLGLFPSVGLRVFALSYYILFCYVLLLSLRSPFFSKEREKGWVQRGGGIISRDGLFKKII